MSLHKGSSFIFERGMEMRLTESELVETVTDAINNLTFHNDRFCNLMARQHRTLQQSFTRLCLEWIWLVASPDYGYDERNRASYELCRAIMEKVEEAGNGLPLI